MTEKFVKFLFYRTYYRDVLKMSRPSIKKILNDFESYNHSSIQPLPPIKQAPKTHQDDAVWENKQLSLG